MGESGHLACDDERALGFGAMFGQHGKTCSGAGITFFKRQPLDPILFRKARQHAVAISLYANNLKKHLNNYLV
jgi:hypothetical protein